MCITFSRAASGQPKTAFSPVHKSVHNVCKNRGFMHSYAQTIFMYTIYARVLHELCTGFVPFSNFLVHIF